MGTLFSTPHMTAPAPPPPVAPPPTPVDPSVVKAGADARRRALAGMGDGGTILTGPQGLTTMAQTTNKPLLGS